MGGQVIFGLLGNSIFAPLFKTLNQKYIRGSYAKVLPSDQCSAKKLKRIQALIVLLTVFFLFKQNKSHV